MAKPLQEFTQVTNECGMAPGGRQVAGQAA